MKNEFASIIKSDMKMSPTQLMNRYMDEYIDRDYSVDEEYVGVIVDNNDPEKILLVSSFCISSSFSTGFSSLTIF